MNIHFPTIAVSNQSITLVKLQNFGKSIIFFQNPDIREEVLTDILTWLIQHTQ